MMLSPSAVEGMRVQERLDAIELLWRSLTASPEQVPSPEWHGRVLAERLSKIERGEGKFLTLDEVKRRFSTNS
jgi:hypothetical protein